MTERIVTYKQVESKWLSLKTLIENNVRYDDNEIDAGIRMADGNIRCEDIEGLRRIRDEVKAQLSTNLTEVDGLVRGMAAKDVAKDLLDRKQDWLELKQDVEGVKTEVKLHHQLDEWNGEAAQSYRNVLPTQIKALGELAGLASSQSAACDQMALINAAMFAAALEGLNAIRNEMTGYPQRAVYDESAKTVRGAGYLDATYAVRTYAARDLLQNFKTWYALQADLGTADWNSCATDLDDALSSVTSNTTVLGREGEWPGIGTVVHASASQTDRVTSSATSVNESGTGRDHWYIDFN